MSDERVDSPLRAAAARKGSFWRALRAVGWSFFGVRKSKDLEQDVTQLNPLHVILAGLLGAALLVIGLLTLVNWVLSSGVAK